jgi:hypothetical protein
MGSAMVVPGWFLAVRDRGVERLHEHALVAGALQRLRAQRVAVVERLRDIAPHRTEDPVADPVDTLEQRPRMRRVVRTGAHALQRGHVHCAPAGERRLHHTVVTSRAERGAALSNDSVTPAAPGEGQATQGVGQLVSGPEHETVALRLAIERVEGGCQSSILQGVEDPGHPRVVGPDLGPPRIRPLSAYYSQCHQCGDREQCQQ